MSWHIWGGRQVMILETGCWLRPHTKRSKAPACSLVSITTGRVLDKMDSDRGEKEESRLSLLGLRARISLFALVWAEHEQAREEGYIVGPKGWVDMMYKTRRGESKKGRGGVQLGEIEKDRITFQRNDCSELVILQAEDLASLCGWIHVSRVPHFETSVQDQLFYFNWKSHQQGQWLFRIKAQPYGRTTHLLIFCSKWS